LDDLIEADELEEMFFDPTTNYLDFFIKNLNLTD